MHALAVALNFAAALAHAESNLVEMERHASDLIELSARYHFGHWLAIGAVYRGWVHSVSGDTADGILWIEDGIRNYRATGAVLMLPYWLALKAEALHLADRTSEAFAAINEAEAVIERREERWWSPELHRLRGVFSPGLVPTKPKLRLRSVKPSESQRSRSRFRCRSARKPAMRNTAGGGPSVWDTGCRQSKFQWPGYQSPEVLFLAEKRMSLSSMAHGQTRM